MITIDHTYEELKSFYDNNLNKNVDLFETSNDEPTPLSCVEEMIASIPESFWERDDIKILDPCCGSGNFMIVIYHKLLQYHSKETVLDMLHFNDINSKRLKIVQEVFDCDTIDIREGDFLESTYDLRFDLIVANPPYAKLLPNGKRASKNHNMIASFITKSLDLLKQNGYILYITPDNWMSFSDRNTLITRLTELQIHHINIHLCKKYFKKIGSSFTWYLIENTPFYKDITIEGIWKKYKYTSTVKSQPRSYIPLLYNKRTQSILSKTIDRDNTKFNIETSSDLHKYTKRDLIRNKEDDTHKYRLIHTPKQHVWSSRPHKFQDGYKVFISTTSYYETFVDNCGMTQSIVFIQCDNLETAEKINEVLSHPLYKFINNICRYGNFNNIRILQRFPYCEDFDYVYQEFDITDKERLFIEKYL